MSTFYTAEPSIPSNPVIRTDELIDSVIAKITANSGGPPLTGAHAVYDGDTLIWSAIGSFALESGAELLLEDGITPLVSEDGT